MMRKNRSKLVAEKIKLIDYRIISGKLDNPEGDFLSLREAIGFSCNLDMGMKLEEKIVKSELLIKIEAKGENDGLIEAIYNIVFIFYVENLEELISQKKKEIKVDANLGNAIASISYSTTRGLLIARLQGTVLDGFYLPIINPNGLLKNILK